MPVRNSMCSFVKCGIKPSDRALLKSVFAFARSKKSKLHIVGGYLRDIILKRQKDNPDIDFCIEKDAIQFARALSKKINAGFVVLDEEHGSCRLMKRLKGVVYTLDFTDFRGKTLKDDLLHRDFTMNSIALELDKAISAKNLNSAFIDLYGGGADLKSKIIRLLHKKSFDEDPLRILRAFSLACSLDFKIDKETMRLIRIKKNMLSGVSYERIRDELFKILDTANAYEYVLQMHTLHILDILMPEIEIMRSVKQGPYHHLDVLRHSFETLRQLEIIVQKLRHNKEIQDYLAVPISGQRRRRALIKLAAFLHDIGKPETLRRKNRKLIFHGHERAGSHIAKTIGLRLKLSNDELDALRKMIFCHLRPGYMADNQRLTARSKFRYFRDTAQESVSVLLISLADQRSTRGPLTSQESRMRHEKVTLSLIKEYFKKQKEKTLPRLINGDDLIEKLKLQPGPLIGKILSRIEELQATGRVKTRTQAFAAAKKMILQAEACRGNMVIPHFRVGNDRMSHA